jgi:hypothetical protein
MATCEEWGNFGHIFHPKSINQFECFSISNLWIIYMRPHHHHHHLGQGNFKQGNEI